MLRFQNNRHPPRLKGFDDYIGDLSGQALLKLRPAGKNLNNPGKLAGSYHASVRDITYVGHAVKGEEMVFAHGIKGDILGNNHLLMPLFKSNLKVLLRVFVHAAEYVGIHFGNASGRSDQTFSFGVIANGFD